MRLVWQAGKTLSAFGKNRGEVPIKTLFGPLGANSSLLASLNVQDGSSMHLCSKYTSKPHCTKMKNQVEGASFVPIMETYEHAGTGHGM